MIAKTVVSLLAFLAAGPGCAEDTQSVSNVGAKSDNTITANLAGYAGTGCAEGSDVRVNLTALRATLQPANKRLAL